MWSVVWLEDALEDLEQILGFIAEQNPTAARRLKARLEAAPLALSQHPYLHPVGRVPGTREVVVHPNYVLVYRVARECIEVVSVLHARQQYPDSST